jgi:hypothetical protein
MTHHPEVGGPEVRLEEVRRLPKLRRTLQVLERRFGPESASATTRQYEFVNSGSTSFEKDQSRGNHFSSSYTARVPSGPFFLLAHAPISLSE